jgi:hypothetical protein
MTSINPELLQALAHRLEKSPRQVYRRIDNVVRETFLERSEAALVLAAQFKLPIHMFSTVHDRRRIAAFRGRAASTSADWDELRGQHLTKFHKVVKVDLSRIADSKIRAIVKRDVAELNAAAVATPRSAKMCMIHAGTIAEALLLDKVCAQPAAAVIVAVAALIEKPRSNDPREWSLDKLVQVAKQLTPLLREDVLTGAKQLKDLRNLVHPGLEVRSGSRVVVSQGRADAAIAFLGMLIEDLECNS